MLLVSFNLASNRPENFTEMCDNLQETAADPTCLEVIVKIDTDDEAMQACVAREQARRPFAIKALSTPGEGYFKLWKALNTLHRELCDPDVYFVCNINDEIRFLTKGWDERLRAYIGFFPDDVFRLKISQFKLRNYSDYWENGYAPENYAFYTKKWIDIGGGDWNACHGPDAFQQFIAFYLMQGLYPAKEQINRDVPIWDMDIGGEGAFLGLTEEQHARRVRQGWIAWYILVSHRMQEEAFRRARLLQGYVMAKELGYEDFELVDEPRRRRVVVMDGKRSETLIDAHGRPLRLSYRLSRLRIGLTNLLRRPLQGYWCGGGREVLPIALRKLVPDRFRLRWYVTQIEGELQRREALRNVATVRPAGGGVCGGCGLPTVVAEATDSVPSHPPAALLSPTADPWGSQETSEDTVVWLRFTRPVAPTAVSLILFSPGWRLHIADVSVVGRINGADGRPGPWEILPARVGAFGDYAERVRIQPSPDFARVTLSIDPAALGGRRFDGVGIACFSESRGYQRNHLPEGRGIYLRGLAVEHDNVVERQVSAGENTWFSNQIARRIERLAFGGG